VSQKEDRLNNTDKEDKAHTRQSILNLKQNEKAQIAKKRSIRICSDLKNKVF